jgi:hypothetical protein
MKRVLLGLAAGALLALLPGVAGAHHSAAVLYHLDQQITVEGTVTRFTLGNPHARIFLSVKGADGSTTEWMAEGGSRTILLRKGWTGDEVKAGDAIKIVGNPSRDGSNSCCPRARSSGARTFPTKQRSRSCAGAGAERAQWS